jgi:tetratricopeptide (TPR) repeat protein
LAGDERAMQRLQDLAGIVEARRLPRSLGVFCALAEVRRLRGDAAGALALARKGRAAAEAESPGSGSALSCRIEIGLALVALGEHEAAIAELREALTAIEAAVPGFTPTRADVQGGLGLAHLAAGRPGEALPHLEAADAFWRWFDPDNRFAGEAADALKRARAAVTGTAD